MRLPLILLVLAMLVHSQSSNFLIDEVTVHISDISDDGSAKVKENIKFVMYGEYSNSLYDSGIAKNSLTIWANNTELKDVKIHVNTAHVDVRDFRLRPQPRTQCNPIQEICHGELILDYMAYPSYNDTMQSTPVIGTGLFRIEQYKPRTKRYTLNPNSLSFTTTSDGNVVLDENVYLTIELPSDSMLLDVNPYPSDEDLDLPVHVPKLSWTDIVLVKFSLVFDVEQGIDQEISGFFTGITRSISSTLSSPEGFAIIVLMVVLIGSYFYIVMAKRRGEE
jgi:hypothetical protein